MKNLINILCLVLATPLIGQIADRTETNCDGESLSIYEVGDMGMPLIVASKGFDCTICHSQADNVRDFANANEDLVAVWAAMTNTYSSAIPTCGELANWSSTYNWGESIFAFIDETEYWLELGTPRYYVIHPATREIAYEGSSFSTATSTALGLITTSAEEFSERSNLKIYQTGNELTVENPDQMEGELRIYSITGKQVFSVMLNQGTDRFFLQGGLDNGIYIASWVSEGVQSTIKFVFIH